MANSRVALEVEDWVTSSWLNKKYGQAFRKKQLTLTCGGKFEFDAVSEDGSIVVVVSTATGVTATGKNPSGKIHKIRSDMFFLLLV